MDTCYVTIIIQCKGHEFEDEEDQKLDLGIRGCRKDINTKLIREILKRIIYSNSKFES